MAKCSKCGKEVGCGCNLITGSCHTCYNKQVSLTSVGLTETQAQSLQLPVVQNPPPNTEFDKILKTQGLSKEEKLKRINDILEKGIQNALNQ